ncbi:MAG TPA: CBS domain-containing protein [Polyangiaceae bacterium]|nr:CBS domain-containing protein [Polyangiaceae bacterium]
MTTLSELLATKGRDVMSIAPDDSVFSAIEAMAKHGVGALLVMDDDKLVGIVSERDDARKVILAGRSSKETPVRAIMSSKVICAEPSRTIQEGMAIMTERKIRHLPVLEGAKVVGVVSIGDLVKAIIAAQKHTIEQLERYVSG